MLVLVLAAALSQTGAGWEITTKTDPMTDVSSYSLTARGDRGLIAFTCDAGKYDTLTTLIGADHFVGYRYVSARPLTYRFDDKPPVEVNLGSVGSSFSIRNAEMSWPFFTDLLIANVLRVRVSDATGASHDIVFAEPPVAKKPHFLDFAKKCGLPVTAN